VLQILLFFASHPFARIHSFSFCESRKPWASWEAGLAAGKRKESKVSTPNRLLGRAFPSKIQGKHNPPTAEPPSQLARDPKDQTRKNRRSQEFRGG